MMSSIIHLSIPSRMACHRMGFIFIYLFPFLHSFIYQSIYFLINHHLQGYQSSFISYSLLSYHTIIHYHTHVHTCITAWSQVFITYMYIHNDDGHHLLMNCQNHSSFHSAADICLSCSCSLLHNQILNIHSLQFDNCSAAHMHDSRYRTRSVNVTPRFVLELYYV